MSKKLTIEYVDGFFEKYDWILLESRFVNIQTKLKCLCPNGHLNTIIFTNFKYNNSRCRKCSKEKIKLLYKHDFLYVKKYIENFNYILLSNNYINSKKKLLLQCPNNHVIKINFNNFQTGHRCKICHLNYLSIKKQNNKKLGLNKKLRINKEKKWIIKNMKHDPNYELFLKNTQEYVLDHIFPIKAFQEYIQNNNIKDLIKFKKISNLNKNLQLLTIKENAIKSDKYDKTQFLEYIKNNYIEENLC